MRRIHIQKIATVLLGLLIGGLVLAAPSQDKLNAALISAVKRGDLATAKQLLVRGANPNAREVVIPKPTAEDPPTGPKPFQGDTALMLAVQSRNLNLVKLLLQKGADVNGRGQMGFTPLLDAVDSYRPTLVKFLLAHGAKPNQQNDYGDTALVFAANSGQNAVVTILLAKGADINGGTSWTPLMQAAYNGFEATVKLLLQKGARVNFRRKGLMNALECAEVQGNDTIVTLLKRAGGRGRSQEALQKAAEEAAKEIQNQRHADALPWKQEQVLTDQDKQVLETVLLDILAYKGEDFETFVQNGTTILLLDKATRGLGLISDDQINGELDDTHANEITTEMRQHLQRRNGDAISLQDFKPVSNKIIVGNIKPNGDLETPFHEQYPDARCWVEAFLPGYSAQGNQAIVRFWFGPTPHGAAGTYFLSKQQGVWRVKWHHFTHFL